MEKKEFKVGDKVAIEDSQYSGVVTEICNGRCKVRYPSGRVMNFPVEVLEHRDDPKTAFLHDLSELLRKYNAEFSDYENYEVIFNLGDKMSIFIDTTDVFNWTNADNLLERATFSDDKE